ncbi:MAG: hypothetical protein IPJ34_35615 [Myxococcales bacterium]|nr:hypothetical protein [Myxococcales bacterium]
MLRPTLALLTLGILTHGCSSSSDAPVDEDPQFTSDWVDDFEADAEDEAATAAEQAEVDRVDDLDDVEILDETPGPTSASFGTKGAPPKRPPHGPLSILQDDPNFSGYTWTPDPNTCVFDEKKAAAAVGEARALGANVIRVMLFWKDAVRCKHGLAVAESKDTPSFSKTDPASYDFRRWDNVVTFARGAGLKVMLTLGAPMPFWGSQDPATCVARAAAGDWSCGYRPDPRKWAQFVTAVGRHFKGQRIWAWTLWNEPNLRSFFDVPDGNDKGKSSADERGFAIRSLWFSARRHLRKTAGVRARIFFGDGAGKDSESALLDYTLCLREDGSKLVGPDARRCPDRARVVHASGLAFHDYATSTKQWAAIVAQFDGYLANAEKQGRIDKGRGLYLTEGGFLTAGDTGPAKVSEAFQRDAIDVTRRLAWEGGRLHTIAQYEIWDDAHWGSGLRTVAGVNKPSYASYPIGVDLTKVSATEVVIFAHARLASGTMVTLEARYPEGWKQIDGIPTDALGFGHKQVAIGGATAFRVNFGGELGVGASREVTP